MYACAGARAAGWLDGRTFHAVLDLLFWRIAVYFIFIPLMVGGSEDAQRRCLHCQTAAHLYMYVVMTLMRLALVSFLFFFFIRGSLGVKVASIATVAAMQTDAKRRVQQLRDKAMTEPTVDVDGSAAKV